MGILKNCLFGGVLAGLTGVGLAQEEYGGGTEAPAHHEEHEWSSDAEVTLEWDENLSKAFYERDKVEDVSALYRLSHSVANQINRQHLISYGLFFGAKVHDDIDPLSHGTLGFRGAWRSVHGSGFTQPIFEVNVTARYDDYGVEQRDSFVQQVQFFMTKRFTDRITTTLGGDYTWRDSQGTVFDTEEARVFVNLDYRVWKNMALYLTGSNARGDVVSSSQIRFCNGAQADDILPLVNAATAIEPDEAFNQSLCGEWVAYRGDAETRSGTFGFNMPVGHSSSLDLSVIYADVENQDWDVGYERTLYRASFLTRF